MIGLREKPIEWYCGLLARGWQFSLAGFSDAEWYCMLGLREGQRSGLGQVFSAEHGKRLTEIVTRRKDDHRFMLAMPKCLPALPEFSTGAIGEFLWHHSLRLWAYERDMVTDDLAREANLYPLISQLQKLKTVMIGPHALNHPDMRFLGCAAFVGIDGPNLHLKPGGIEDAVARAVKHKPAVYLVSAGVSAAVIIDQLTTQIPYSSTFMDCGSIWDAFVRIGEQRQWRAELYEHRHKERWEQWRQDNILGKQPIP